MQKFAKKLCKAQLQKRILMKIQTQIFSGSSINVFLKNLQFPQESFLYYSIFSEYNPLCGVSVRFKKPSVFVVYILSELVCSFVVLPKCAAQERVVIIHENQQLYIGFAVKRTCVGTYLPLASPCTSIISHSALLIPN